MLAYALRWLRAHWPAIRDRVRAPVGRLRAGWAYPPQRRDAVRYLAGAAVLAWLSLALVIGSRATPVLITAGLAALCSLLCLAGALIVLWGRDL